MAESKPGWMKFCGEINKRAPIQVLLCKILGYFNSYNIYQNRPNQIKSVNHTPTAHAYVGVLTQRSVDEGIFLSWEKI